MLLVCCWYVVSMRSLGGQYVVGMGLVSGQYVVGTSTNMGKHCLQLVLTLLPLFSPYAQQFSKQTDEQSMLSSVIF